MYLVGLFAQRRLLGTGGRINFGKGTALSLRLMGDCGSMPAIDFSWRVGEQE
jgi:hypothetical protein